MRILNLKYSWLFAVLLTLPLASHGFMFDPDGEGGVDAVDMEAFDVTQSSILNADGITAIDEGVGAKLKSYNHGNISALTNSDGVPVFYPRSEGHECEITIVLGLDTEIVAVDGNKFTSAYDPAAETLNFFEMWFDDTCNADPLAGTGFNDGTLIMSGRFTSLYSSFTVTETANLVPLDSLTKDNWEPVVTVTGQGNANNVRIRVESFDPAFFPDLNSGDFIVVALQNYSQALPYISTNPSELYVEAPGGGEAALAPTIGANTGNDGNYAENGIQGPDLVAQTDVNISLRSTPIVQQGACRMTGGNATLAPVLGPDERETWTYDFEAVAEEVFSESRITTGGQINAPSRQDPVRGHWTHSQHGGANGNFTFHAGTSSAPQGTEISTVECADPGWCVGARCAPFKQLFWTGIGNFANQHYSGIFPSCEVRKGQRGTLHRVEVMIGDFGENDRPTREEGYMRDTDPENCNWSDNLADAGYTFPTNMPWTAADAVPLSSAPDPKFGYRDGQVCDKCPDYYQIRIFCDESAASDVIYEFSGYLQNGNYQIHPETGEQCPATPQLSAELFETSTIDDTPTDGGGNGNGKGPKKNR